MLRAISLFLVLFVLWLLLSGHYEPLMLILGVVSCVGVVVIAWRMDVIDHEGHPVQLGPGILLYWPWLLWQIAKANVEVARLILHPKLPIEPMILKSPTSQGSELGLVVYANSITLTPGTVSVDVDPTGIQVHCLSRRLAADFETGEMDRRVSKLEGQR